MEDTGTRVESILNFKGGIGKTTTVINLSDYMARAGMNVVVIDGDRQRNLSTIVPGYRQDQDFPRTLKEVIEGDVSLFDALIEARPGLYVCPSHRSLEKATKYLQVSGRKTQKHLAYEIANLNGIDIVLIDHSPSYTPLTDALLLASTGMIIPLELEAFAMEGLIDMIAKLTESLDELEHSVAITGIVPCNLDFTKTMTTTYLTSLRERFKDKVLPYIRTDTQISRSQSVYQTVFEYNQHSKAVEDYAALARALVGDVVLAA